MEKSSFEISTFRMSLACGESSSLPLLLRNYFETNHSTVTKESSSRFTLLIVKVLKGVTNVLDKFSASESERNSFCKFISLSPNRQSQLICQLSSHHLSPQSSSNNTLFARYMLEVKDISFNTALDRNNL